ncbi:LLM class flavin-dependent oxidoreductase [Mycobacterium sp. NPDC006124]|uniref:LLM class flavin-dependent oxidoreductase n=1 Tax=Mycobacterium sp. NPDC006124 TaxID=3156729 RepID=UPI0033AC7EDA
MSPTLGVIFRPDFPPHELRRIATEAEAAGVDELWLWEDCFQQGGVAQVAVALAATERLCVGIGLIPAPLRNVTAAAMEFGTLEATFPGRTRVAVGHGVQSWMRQAGAAVASPLTLLREYVTALRALLAGEEVTTEGRYVRLSRVRLDFPSARPYPILVGGTGPKTLRLAGEIADGVLLDSRYTTETVTEALRHVAEGRAVADDPTRSFSTTLFLACAPGDGADSRLAAEAARQEAPTPGAFGVGGDADRIAEGLAPYLDAGVDAVALQPLDSVTGATDVVAVAGRVRALTP